MICPKCKLENPEETIRCDCGYDFTNMSMQRSPIKNAYEKPSTTLMVIGWIFSILGGLIG